MDFPSDSTLAPPSSLLHIAAPLLHDERLRLFSPGLSMRRVPGMARGLFSLRAALVGDVLVREEAVAWEEEVSGAAQMASPSAVEATQVASPSAVAATQAVSKAEDASRAASIAADATQSSAAPALSEGERLVRMWRHPVLSVRDVCGIAYQMAPFHAERAGARVVDAEGAEVAAVTRFELLSAVLAANSFAVAARGGAAASPESGAHSTLAAPSSSAGPMHLSGESHLDALYAASGVTGRALFPTLGLANHSCGPNAKVTEVAGAPGAGPAPPAYLLEARQPIQAGEEVTIAYVPRSWPRALRQQELQGTWGFTCACSRCTQPWDDCIVLRCHAPACEGGGGSAHGRVYWGRWVCEECGASALEAQGGAAAGASLHAACHSAHEFDLDADLAAACVEGGAAAAAGPEGVWGVSPLPARAIAERLLAHPLLATEDYRVFRALNRLATAMSEGELCEEETEAGGEGGEELATRVATAVALAAMRAAFTSPEDLGIEIQYE